VYILSQIDTFTVGFGCCVGMFALLVLLVFAKKPKAEGQNYKAHPRGNHDGPPVLAHALLPGAPENWNRPLGDVVHER